MLAASTGSASSPRSIWSSAGIDVVLGFAAFEPLRPKFGGEFRLSIDVMHTSWSIQRWNPIRETLA